MIGVLIIKGRLLGVLKVALIEMILLGISLGLLSRDKLRKMMMRLYSLQILLLVSSRLILL